MTDFYSADLHLGHYNIIKYCNRPFNSVEEMDKTIIENINAKVGKSDRFFCIGDFAFRNHASHYLKQLVCKNVWLIKGNHDYKPSREDGFSEVKDYYEVKYDIGDKHKKRVVLFHYPIREWNQWHRASYHAYGHVHGQRSGLKGLHPNEYCIDVGVDCHDFSPISFEEMHELMKQVDWKDPFETWEKEGTLYKGPREKQIPADMREFLSAYMHDDLIDDWWSKSFKRLGNRTPQEAFLSGKEDAVWELVQEYAEIVKNG